ncbi:hypothetical protein [Runella sp. SP2]|uniref:hypothetical protein n=1 Tax=Runella sp. SP2 TaxID=2268026 RepID=UPI000F073660|nr:hypothetical protein [Runella sp. SP2]AYQ31033.1 hypothetical protein DTQ70_02050 [Runella sp. SP2]
MGNTSWAPYAVFTKPSEIELKYNSEKQREVTASVSSSICTKAEIEVLMSNVCIEAKNTLKESMAQIATVTRKEKLAAYQQARLAIYARYEYFTGTLVVVPFNGNGPGSIAPMEYRVYWKIPKYTYVKVEKRTVK